ncbi:hypothetical protein GGTG_04435, partial [Gaeumannomyces tritici R3-111a-1]
VIILMQKALLIATMTFFALPDHRCRGQNDCRLNGLLFLWWWGINFAVRFFFRALCYLYIEQPETATRRPILPGPEQPHKLNRVVGIIQLPRQNKQLNRK